MRFLWVNDCVLMELCRGGCFSLYRAREDVTTQKSDPVLQAATILLLMLQQETLRNYLLTKRKFEMRKTFIIQLLFPSSSRECVRIIYRSGIIELKKGEITLIPYIPSSEGESAHLYGYRANRACAPSILHLL